MGRYQSGQLGQTVKLLSYDFVGSNPALPTNNGVRPDTGITGPGLQMTNISGSSSVGRASAFQAEGRGFEFRLPLMFLPM